jgi:hypothetical protein
MPGCFVANNGTCVRQADRTSTEVCNRYVADSIDATVEVFTPGAATCDVGQTVSSALDATLRRLNLFRWLVGLRPITRDASTTALTTACAAVTAHRTDLLDLPAGGVIDLHHFPTTTPCWTQAGADGAGTSLVSTGVDHPADGIDEMMFENGVMNHGILGHRRLILEQNLANAGFGYSRDRATGMGAGCVHLTPFDDFGPQTSLDGMTMYPSPGPFPWEATTFKGVEEVLSWSFVLPAVIGLEGAQVSMYIETSAGLQPVEITSGPAGGTFNEAALWITPKADLPRGASVVVEISNIPVGALGWRVLLTDCGTMPANPGPFPCDLLAQNCATPGYACRAGEQTDPGGVCRPAGAFPVGTPCLFRDSCAEGTDCFQSLAGKFVCTSFCDFGPSPRRDCNTTCPFGSSGISFHPLPDGDLEGIGICLQE